MAREKDPAPNPWRDPVVSAVERAAWEGFVQLVSDAADELRGGTVRDVAEYLGAPEGKVTRALNICRQREGF